jgi:heptosyltransferase-1
LPDSLLLVKTSSLGDLVHMLPAVTDIHTHFPDLRIDWVAEESFVEIPSLHPAITKIIPVALRRWRNDMIRRVVWTDIGRFLKDLRNHHYSIVLDTQGLLKSAVIMRLARGNMHCGQDRRSIREPLATLFYNKAFSIRRDRHAIIRNRELAARVFGYPSGDSPPDYGLTQVPLAKMNLNLPAAYIVFLHGTSRESKLWPENCWVKLGNALAVRGLSVVLPWGNDVELRRANRLAVQISASMILPSLSIRELVSMLAGAQAVIGLDTGLSHLAAALARPTLAIFTDTSPVLTGVMGSMPEQVANLGDRGVLPTPQEVLNVLERMEVI